MHNTLFSRGFFSCCLLITGMQLFAQVNSNALDGYSPIDNNLGKVPKLFIGIHPFSAEFRQGVSIRPGAHFKVRGDRFGELQVTATYTPSFLVKTPVSPFGNNYRCSCADNNLTAYTDAEASYAFYFLKFTREKNYKVWVERPGITFSGQDWLRVGQSQRIKGQVNRFYGLRMGAAYQEGEFYQLSTKRLRAYDGFQQRLVFAGISRTSIGRMFSNFEGIGIKGKNYQTTIYADAFYALNQDFHYQQVPLFDAQGLPRTEPNNNIPFGGRIGITTYRYGFRSTTAVYANFEVGVRPTFDDAFNGIYAGVKIGVGIGGGKTPVTYISRQKGKSSLNPNIDGNGKYKERGTVGRALHKRKPLKMIRHRYGR